MASSQGFLSLYEEQRQHARVGSSIPIISNILKHTKRKHVSTILAIFLLVSFMPVFLLRSGLERSLQSTTQASVAGVELNMHGCMHGVAVGTDPKGTKGLLALINSIISNYQPLERNNKNMKGGDDNEEEGNDEDDDKKNLCIFIFSNNNDKNERKESVNCAFGGSNLQNVKIIHKTFDKGNWNPIIYSQSEEHLRDMEYKWFRYYLTPQDVDGLEKILYLDTDIIVQGNIAELFDWHMNDHVIAATNYWEPFRNHLCHNHKLSEIRMKIDDIGWFGRPKTVTPFDVPNHINTGLLLMNLEKMSSEQVLDKWARLLQMHNDECLWLEDYQGEAAFTLALKGDIEKLPDEWNVGNLGTPEKFRLIGGCDRAKALHWNGSAKPYTNEGRAQAFCSEFYQKYDVMLQPGCFVDKY